MWGMQRNIIGSVCKCGSLRPIHPTWSKAAGSRAWRCSWASLFEDLKSINKTFLKVSLKGVDISLKRKQRIYGCIYIYIRTHLDFMRRKVGWSLVHWKSKALSFTRTTAPFPHLSPVLDLILRLQMHCLILLVHTKFLHVCTVLYHSSSWLCWTRGRSSDTKSSRSSWGPCLACIVLLHSLSMSCSWGTFNLGFWCCLHIWLLGWYIKW